MKISINYLKRYIDFDLPNIDELANVIGARLGALEEQPIDLTDKYKDVVIVKVESTNPIKDTDHLNLCLVNDGMKTKNVKRNKDGLVEVVCGAPNVRNGILAAWLPPGAILPSSYHKEQFKLETRKIRGQMSNGMLASPRELDISEDHEGILEIDIAAKPGDSFLKAYSLDDYVIDIENKMFTHRPDCFGLIGVAREVSGILNKSFHSPKWYFDPAKVSAKSRVNIKVSNLLADKCPRFCLIAVGDIKVKPSPIYIQSYLQRMGIRPINNIVDLTNIVMLETGQPLHAYDLDKLQKIGGQNLTISIRSPKQNETLTLLNGKTIKPNESSIGIAVKDDLVGLGGVMGGANSEVDNQTKTILLEAASFNMYDIRRTSMELGVFSESVTRFTKGQSPLQTKRVLSYAVTRLNELSPGHQLLSGIIEDNHLANDLLKNDTLSSAIEISTNFINARLGLNLNIRHIAELLTNVEFKVKVRGNKLIVGTPFWRTDIEIAEDIVEEVGRLYGYENIKPRTLNRPSTATLKNKDISSKNTVRKLLSSVGANEVLTYSFVSQKLIEDSGQDPLKAFELANASSPSNRYYRLSLIPSLLNKVYINVKAGYDEFALFEIGSYHIKGLLNKEEANIPAEYQSIALVYSSKNTKAGSPYFRARSYLDFLVGKLNIEGVSFEVINGSTLDSNLLELIKPFNKERSALVMINNRVLGIVGEFNSQTRDRLKLPGYSAGFEVASQLFMNAQTDKVYSPLSKYPPVKQDITLKIARDKANFTDVNKLLISELNNILPDSTKYSLKLVDIFSPKSSEDNLNYTFHLEATDVNRTLKDDEVTDILDKLAKSAKSKFDSIRV